MGQVKHKAKDPIPALRAELNKVKRQLSGKSPVTLLTGQVTATSISADSISATALQTGSVTTDALAAGSVTTSTLAASAITADKIAAGAITAASIAAGTITATQIAAGTITSTQIQAGAINADRLYAGAVQAQLIQAQNIATATLTATNIAAGTITATQIHSATITATVMAADSITTSALQADSVTSAKIAANTIVAGDIAANTITATQIAAGTITAGLIAAGTITATQIAANTITSGLLATGAVTSAAIVSGAVDATKISVSSLSAVSSNMGTITAGTITGATIRTSSSNPKVQMDASGLVGTDSGGASTFFIDATTGNVTIKGTIQSGSSVPASTLAGVLAAANVPAIGGANLQSNSSFEAPAGYFTGWSTGGNCTSAAETALVHQGGQSVKLTATGAGGAIYIANLAARPSVVAGSPYLASAWVYSSIARTWRIYIYGYDSGGAAVGSVSKDIAVPANTWTRLVGDAYTLPAGSVSARTTVMVLTSVAGESYYIDDVQIEQGVVATAYGPRPDEILAGSITGPELAAGSVTAGKILANTITATELAANSVTAADMLANTITAGQIQSGTITATQIQAGSITADRMSVTSLSAIAANLGTITAGTITGATFQTAASGARVALDATGLRYFDSTSSETLRLSSSTSGMQMLASTTTLFNERAITWNRTINGTQSAQIAGWTVGTTTINDGLTLSAGANTWSPTLYLRTGPSGTSLASQVQAIGRNSIGAFTAGFTVDGQAGVAQLDGASGTQLFGGLAVFSRSGSFSGSSVGGIASDGSISGSSVTTSGNQQAASARMGDASGLAAGSFAAFGHSSAFTSTGYTLLGSTTDTFLNCTGGRTIYFRQGNADIFRLSDNGAGAQIFINGQNGATCFVNQSLVGVKLTNGATAWASNSDARLKEDVRPLGKGIETVRMLRPVSYRFKANPSHLDRQVGFIAQEVLRVYSEAVPNDPGDDMLSLTPTDFVPLLTRAVQDVDRDRAALERQVSAFGDLLRSFAGDVADSIGGQKGKVLAARFADWDRLHAELAAA